MRFPDVRNWTSPRVDSETGEERRGISGFWETRVQPDYFAELRRDHGHDDTELATSTARRIFRELESSEWSPTVETKHPSDDVNSWDDIEGADLEEIPSSRTSTKTAFFDFQNRVYWFDFPGHDMFFVGFEEMDMLVKKYVYAGQNWNQARVVRYAINELATGIQWRRSILDDVFRAIELTKDKPPFAPHKFREASNVELAGEWRSHDEARVEKEYRTGEAEHYRELYEDTKERLLAAEDYFHDLVETAEILKPAVDCFERREVVSDIDPASLVVLLSDWHIGRDVDLPGNDFDAAVAGERVKDVTRGIVAEYEASHRPIDEVVITALGDFLDGVFGDMHPQQWEGQDINGLKQIVRASDLLAYVITALDEYFDAPVRVEAIGGNHGRGRKSHDEDVFRLPELAMYELAREKSPDTVAWTIHDEAERAARTSVRGTELVLTHGDDVPRDIAELGRVSDAQDVLVVAGHGHEDERRRKLEGRTLVARNGCLVGTTEFDRDKIARTVRPCQSLVEVRDRGPVPGSLVYAD